MRRRDFSRREGRGNEAQRLNRPTGNRRANDYYRHDHSGKDEYDLSSRRHSGRREHGRRREKSREYPNRYSQQAREDDYGHYRRGGKRPRWDIKDSDSSSEASVSNSSRPMSKSRSVRHRREIPCRHRSDSSHSSASMGRGPHQLRGEARRFDEKSSPGGVEGLQQLISGHGNQLLPHCGNMRRRDEDDTEHHPLITGESHAAPSRVTLYGVDLGVQPCHVSSMLEQLVGQRPLNVFRPVAELWRSCRRTMGSTPENMEILGFCEDGHIVAPENRLHLGLHDVRGAGGVMLVELSQANDVLAVVTALNGACVNGRQITAIANS